MSIPRLGFVVTALVYVALLFAEYLRPGFVSTAMNVHLLFLVLAAWLIALARNERAGSDGAPRRFPFFIVLLCAILLALVTWNIGGVFGDMRLLFSVGVGILVIVVFRSSRLTPSP